MGQKKQNFNSKPLSLAKSEQLDQVLEFYCGEKLQQSRVCYAISETLVIELK